ncbi:MAG: hypothetical protein WCB91_03895, partial [Halobacteriota archaeon]
MRIYERVTVELRTALNCTVGSLEIGGHDESMILAPDYDLWLRVLCYVKIVKLDRVLAKWE